MALLIVLAACSGGNKFDDAAIERDIENRPAQELYDAAETMTFAPPADGRLSEKEITDFVRMANLADRIRKVAERRFGKQADRASTDAGALSRMGDSFAAFGTLRAFATANLRASLDLGLNPKEEEWVDRRIGETIPLIAEQNRLHAETRRLRAAADAEATSGFSPVKRELALRAEAHEREVLRRYEPSVVDDAKLVRVHASELYAYYPELKRAMTE